MPPLRHETTNLRICALAGGVGGARLAHGLQQRLGPGLLSVVVNTGDDFTHLGLRICPDLDTVMYTLGGVADPERGWGLVGDTSQAMDMLRSYGAPTWFTLGDRDLGTHLARTHLLGTGQRLTTVTSLLCDGLGVAANLLPMSDEPVATVIVTREGERLDFQEYFVGRRHADEVAGIELDGIGAAAASPEAQAALLTADAMVLCPSNPFVSIAPILAVAPYRELLSTLQVPRIAVSPIIGGAAVKGPAASMLSSLGHECSALGVARLYQGLVDIFLIDEADAGLAPAINALGMRAVPADIMMRSVDDRVRLAGQVIECLLEARGLGHASTSAQEPAR